MKKKNLLMMALSVCMVGVVAVGGTLAYLTDSDGKVTNTFKFADNIAVSLDEEAPDDTKLGDAEATPQTDGKGYVYSNVVKGQTLPKEPKIELTSYSVDTYVFAKIKNETNGNVTIGAINSAWTACGEDADGNKIYGRLVDVSETLVDTATPLFSEVTISGENAAEATQSLGDITIYVSAIQANGIPEVQGKSPMEAALAQVTQWETTNDNA